jgi:2',3'-cyclic-nucleotide 2'-phosphodiesterase (5'-nucleotidase family)
VSDFSSLGDVFKAIERVRDRLAAVIVHMNDTYLIEERRDQGFPGFARVTATVKKVREHVRQTLGANRTLVLHSGDFLAPSRVSDKSKGEVMIDLLNEMGLDYCVLGNHEFDYGADVLQQRLSKAEFGVLLANASCPTCDWPGGTPGRPAKSQWWH